MTLKSTMLFSSLLLAAAAAAAGFAPNMGPGPHYATDAFPGFDSEEGILPTPRKSPSFLFSWWKGPKRDDAPSQLAWARECAAGESYGRARRAYDALVAEWPDAPEAPRAQEELADLCRDRLADYVQAFAEYKYLLDFYSSSCDYDGVVAKMYDTARAMRAAGKRIMFVRFSNTVDVRRAFECVVLRAPGAKFAPAAMLAVAELREDEGLLDKAVEVYENLRGLYPESAEAKVAVLKEGEARMRLLREHEYNRDRCRDTISFLKAAAESDAGRGERRTLDKWRAEASALVEREAYEAARFYDSRTRTRRSAVRAYERFLAEYPAGAHADEARARLAELKKEAAR